MAIRVLSGDTAGLKLPGNCMQVTAEARRDEMARRDAARGRA
jgi:hypothetical protein